ncbi:unnamed protein product [Polarella glacialis]|uniref:Transposase Tc1-like domain-containing protein n=1 Tax=Polarella glacialis TaxID=89957 RepID=A0A813I6Q5_POLGL|nr:unnamed protein product [Polarella glacialis]
MAPHLTAKELDRSQVMSAKSKTPVEIHAALFASRSSRNVPGPDLTTVRRALKGDTHRRGAKETRGRKLVLTKKNLRRINTIRKALIKQAKGEREVHLEECIRKARVPMVHPSTVSRALKTIGVAWRTPHQKPLRLPSDEKERVDMCSKWKRLPNDYFTDRVDAIMDNKSFQIPTYMRAKSHAKERRVKGHLRTRSEGLDKGFIKPSDTKNKVNPGATASVCAAIINCRVKVWDFLPKRWCGQAAEELYKGPLIKALQKHRSLKNSYTILEDSDPTGYKCNKGKAAKAEVGIKAFPWPRYSPDLNPLDYFLWAGVNRRMAQQGAPRAESLIAYKKRMRRTAFAIPEAVIRKAVSRMKSRGAAVVAAGGGDMKQD